MSQRRGGFPAAFYVANAMEVFERLAWYGFFTVSSLYMTTSLERGGLGLSNAERGVLQGVIPFFVYLLPVLTGAIGDRVGYRRMFLAAFAILAPAYYLLGEMRSFPAFFAAYMLVALGAATFKPLVVGTVARVTDSSNRGIGFGIFYLMVNVGGFLGPVLAGAARAISWHWVFVLSSSAIAVNLLLAFALFRDPPAPPREGGAGLRAALQDARSVLGNGRFALAVAVPLLMMMLAGGGWIAWRTFFVFALVWGGLQYAWDRLARDAQGDSWLRQKLRVGDKPFLIYLLVTSLFWAAYYQIYLTLPLYIRDFVDTGDLVHLSAQISPSLSHFLASVDVAALATTLARLASDAASLTPEAIATARSALAELQVRPPLEVLAEGLRQIAGGTDAREVAARWADQYRQVNPEYIISLDFLSIVLFQYFVSTVAARLRVFAVLIGGTLLIGLSYALGGFAHVVPMAGSAAAAMVVLFAFGEMLAAPKSQEYVASIAPASGAALFMGYYFVSSALGLLLAGVLSGWGYEVLALKLGAPTLMWAAFAAMAGVAALALYAFNILILRKRVPHAPSGTLPAPAPEATS